MGYYVRTTGSNFYVAQSKKNAAYEALCALNQRDDLKTGGSFSWMAADYPSKCEDLKEVLEEVGFDVVEDEAGNVTGLHYDSKTGQESLFLSALAPFVRDGSHIDWQGEEGEHFRYEFSGGRMLERDGRIVWA